MQHQANDCIIMNRDDVGDLFELDVYRAAPGALPGLVATFGAGEAGVADGRSLVAAWTCEFGLLNRLLTLSRISPGAASTTRAPELPGQVEFQRRVLRLERPLFTDVAAHVVEFRTYSIAAGDRDTYLQKMLPALPIRERHSRNIGVWTPVDEDPDQVLHFWAYEDVADRMRARTAAFADADWKAYIATVYPHLRRMTSEILLPTACSPLR